MQNNNIAGKGFKINGSINRIVLILIFISLLNIFLAFSSNPDVNESINKIKNPIILDSDFEKNNMATGSENIIVKNEPEKITDGAGCYFIVNLYNPGLDPEQQMILNQHNLEIEEYLSSDMLLAFVPKDSISSIQALDFIDSLDAYDEDNKYGSYLREQLTAFDQTKDDPENILDDKRFPVLITLFENHGFTDKDDIKSFFLNYGIEIEIESNRLLKFTGNTHEIEIIASFDFVKWLEYDTKYHLHNDIAASIIGAPALWSELGYNGSGQVVAVFDSGLDYGVDNESMHKDFKGRIKKIINYFGTSPDDLHGHGTHVAGSIVGTGAQSSGNIRGIAHGAELVFQAGGDDAGTLSLFPPSDLKTLFQDAYDNGARIHSDSWGSSSQAGQYNTRSSDVDSFMWDKNDFFIVISAGNDGPFENTINPPGTAKNAITVGSTENYRPSKSTSADNIDEIYSFSSFGPTDDGRIKPDVMAPGTWILSTRLNKSLEAIPSTNFWGEHDDYYTFMGGTSMATPIVAGAGAVLRQFFMDSENHEPSGALLKAALINGAEDIGIPDIPNNYEGWGRINISKSISKDTDSNFTFIDNSTGLTNNKSAHFQIEVLNDSVPLKITLGYSDYKGTISSGGALINDLDLKVVNNDTGIYLGNAFKSGWSEANTNKTDSVNNVECVNIQTPKVGRYNITVHAKSVITGPQRFALYITGAINPDEILPPGGLAVKSDENGGALNISWWPSLADNISGYRIYRSNFTPDNFEFIKEVPQAQMLFYMDNGLENTVPYFYKLKSITTTGAESKYSKTVKGIPLDSRPPKVNFTFPKNNDILRGNISLTYSTDIDTFRIYFEYYLDNNSDGFPNDNNYWIDIGWDFSPQNPFYWNTTLSGSGPGDADSVILRVLAQDINLNNYTLLITGLKVDNTAPSAPILDPVVPFIRTNPTLLITGTTEPMAKVELFQNKIFSASNSSDSFGNYRIMIQLVDGINNLTARIFDEAGNGPGPFSEQIVIALDRKAPFVNHGGPYKVNIGTSFLLNGSGSHDHFANKTLFFIENFTWIISKNVIRYYYGETPQITLDEFGSYSLTLSVKDGAGNTASSSTLIDVVDMIAPGVNAGGNRTVNEDEWIYFDVYNCTDNDPDFFNTADFQWEIIDPSNENTYVYGRNLTYIFFDLGTYKIILTATDRFNNSDTDVIYIEVLDVTPPVAYGGGNQTAVEFHSILLNGSLSTDNDPDFHKNGRFIWTFSDNDNEIILKGRAVSYTFIEVGSYKITLTVLDNAGNSDVNLFWVKVIDDVAFPEVLSVSPEDLENEVALDAEIKCTISEQIKSLKINDRSFYITDADDEKIKGKISYDPLTSTITFTPFELLSNNIYFCYLTTDIEDLAGNKLSSNYTWRFFTVTPPLIMDQIPSPDRNNVGIDSRIIVVFNEQLLDKSVNPDTLILYDRSETRVDGILTYDNNTFSIIFKPRVKLNFSSEYKIVLDDNIVDLNGNFLEKKYVWNFTTEAEEKSEGRLVNALILTGTVIIIIIIIAVALLIGTGRLKFGSTSAEQTTDQENDVDSYPETEAAAFRKKKVRKKVTTSKRRSYSSDEYDEFDDEFDEFDDEINEAEDDYSVDWQD